MNSYQGKRIEHDWPMVERVVEVAGRPEKQTLTAERSLKIRNHSPDGFNWGYFGSGPSQLALAILLDFTDSEQMALELYQDFKREFVANFHDTWTLSGQQIQDWLLKNA